MQAAEPTREWFTIETPHFRVHYYRSLRHDLAAAAQKVARAAENAHRTLAPVFRTQPSTPTHIVVTDDVDAANGAASVVPYNVIQLFVTGPDSRSHLNDYDDWINVLVMHEYVHILHIDTIHGLPRLVNAVLGKTWAPNQIQPRWFIEGIAVYHETRQTAGGRNRSSIFDMILRMSLLERRWLDLDQISSPTRHYPRGAVPYLYGGRFIQYLADRFGEEKLAEISHRYGGMPVPWSLNRTAHEVYGQGYVELYEQFKEHLKRTYLLQKERVERRGVTPFARVTRHGWSIDSPRFSSSGDEIAYIASDGRSHDMIRVLDVRAGARLRHEQYHLGGQGLAFTPDGRHLVYARGVRWRTFHSYHDLFVQRRPDGAPRQLTDGLRAREPDVSPDGELVAFISSDNGRNDLALIPFTGGQPRVLVRGARGDQMFTPRFSPDGARIAFSYHRSGARDIAVVERGTGRVTFLTQDRAIDMDPQFSSDGRRVYFSSDRTGIFNIYCLDLARPGALNPVLEQVTNVLGGAFAPAVSPDERELYYVGYSARGYDLHRMKLEPARFLPALPYADDRPESARVPNANVPFAVRRYTPWSTIYPRNWSLNVGSDAFGTSLGLTVTGGDVVGIHAYDLAASVSAAKGYVSYAAGYSYDRFWPSLRVRTSRFVGRRGGLVIDGREQAYVEESYGLSSGAGLPVLRMPDHALTLSLGHSIDFYRDADGRETLVLPDQMAPRFPEVGRRSGVTFGVGYSNVERYAESISAERGRRLDLSLRVDSSIFGSEFDNTQLSWSWTEYVDIPWFRDHVLALRYGGGIARGDFSRRGFFFIGGFPEQDIVSSLIDQTALGGVYLRGYQPGSLFGDQFHLLNVEYRLPLLSLERGLSTLPIYVNYLHLAAFSDVGSAFFGDLEASALKLGVGGELLTEWVLGYVVPFTFRLGYARGLMDGGQNSFFFLLGNRF